MHQPGFENGFEATGQTKPEAASPDLVSIGKVQYTLTHALTHIACANNVLLLALKSKPPHLVKIDLNRPDAEELIDLGVAPNGPPLPGIHALYLDPTGRHALISLANQDVYYCFLPWAIDPGSRSKRAKLLAKLKGPITAVSWSPSALSSSTSSATKEILVGTSNGRLVETYLDGELESSRPFGRSHHDRYANTILTVPEKQAIRGLGYFTWQNQAGSSKPRIAIIATTDTRILQYVASTAANSSNGLFEHLASVYKDAIPKSLELPGIAGQSQLHFWHNKQNGLAAQTIAWLTGPGIYHGSLSFSSQESGDGVIESAQLLPYPAVRKEDDDAAHQGSYGDQRQNQAEVPVAMALTEFHFILLYAEKVRVIRALDDQVIYEERLDLDNGEAATGIATDIRHGTFWICTPQAIFELSLTEDDRDIWTVYLKRKAFDTALQYTKTPEQRDLVLGQKADSLFDAGRRLQAADLYAQTSRRFEEVVLKLIERDDKDALRNYLSARLGRLHKSELTQRMMLATWLLENSLGKLNQLEDAALSENDSELAESFKTEQGILAEDIEDFLKTYKDNLDPPTVYDLTSAFGQMDVLLKFATLTGDHQRVLEYHIDEEDWKAALDTLNRQTDVQLYYRHATTLIQHAPEATIDCFIRQPQLDPRVLLPSLLFPSNSGVIPKPVVFYLQHSIHKLHNVDPLVHNALLSLLAQEETEDALIRFLDTAPEDPETNRPYYDLDYALRLCQTHQKIRSSITICSKMQMWESAVEQALKIGDIELAKLNAEGPDQDEIFLKKKMWLQIASHVIGQTHDLKAALQFLDATDLIKIEDILPFFPEFVTIDDFKDDICNALERYSSHIDQLRTEMQQATDSAETIKREIQDLSTRLVVLDAAEKCVVCTEPLLSRQFYVFPCQHAFHADCLVKEVTSFLSAAQLRKVLDLQNQLAQITSIATHDGLSKRNSAALSLNVAPSLAALGIKPIPRNKITTAGFQSMDQLRKLVIPDALVSVIGGGVNEAMRLAMPNSGGGPRARSDSEVLDQNAKLNRLRKELDQILASSCVFCDRTLASLDQGFLAEGETDF